MTLGRQDEHTLNKSTAGPTKAKKTRREEFERSLYSNSTHVPNACWSRFLKCTHMCIQQRNSSWSLFMTPMLLPKSWSKITSASDDELGNSCLVRWDPPRSVSAQNTNLLTWSMSSSVRNRQQSARKLCGNQGGFDGWSKARPRISFALAAFTFSFSTWRLSVQANRFEVPTILELSFLYWVENYVFCCICNLFQRIVARLSLPMFRSGTPQVLWIHIQSQISSSVFLTTHRWLLIPRLMRFPSSLSCRAGLNPTKEASSPKKSHLQLAPLRGEFEGLILRVLHPSGGQRQQGADGGLVVDQVDEPGPRRAPLRGAFRGIPRSKGLGGQTFHHWNCW